MNKSRRFLRSEMMLRVTAILLVASLLSVRAGTVRAGDRPNVLLILADDLAWADLGCYGHPWHETPYLDRLASQGMRFTDGYAPAPICSASRASILTGKSTARLGFEFVTKNDPGRQERRAGQTLETPPFTLNLALEETTVAEHLRDAGYHTAFFGKWHLNAHHGGYLGWSPTHGPKQQGFETATEDFGSHPYSYRGKRKRPAKITDRGRFPNDSMVGGAVRFLKEKRHEPFLLMVSHFYVHTPVQTQCQWLLDKYAAKVPADSPNRERRIAYGAFVETLDHYVGQLLTALDDSGRGSDTLVVFTSDNGGHPEYAANGPLRGSKWNLYEGGIRVPFIVRWPGRVSAGTTCSTPVIGYDLLPTFAKVAGKTAALGSSLDGVSLVPVFEDRSKRIDRSLFWHFPYYHPERGYEKSLKSIGINDFAVSQTRPQSAIRRGDSKLTHFYEDGRSELYDLGCDVGEQNDMSGPQPAAASRLRRELTDYLDGVNAHRPVEANADATGGSSGGGGNAGRRPNVLFVYTDDQAPWGFGASGYAQAYTPNIDRLAREGAYLKNSFVTTPVCSPARASLMTSRYASEYAILDFIPHPGHRLYDATKTVGLDPASITFAEVLRANGYATGLVGKWHLGDWTASEENTYHPTNHGFDCFMGLTGGGTTPDDPLLEKEGAVRALPGLTTDILTNHAIDFIRGHRDKPFLLCLHYRAPHSRWLPVADEDWAPYENLDPVIPNPDYPGLDVERVKRMTREYLASITGVDRNLGRVLQVLDELELAPSTVVIFTSDHGYNMGHNAIFHKGNGIWVTTSLPKATQNIAAKYRPNMYDNSLKVPAIVKWPGVARPGTVIDHTTTSLDWYPTLVEIAGADLPAEHLIRGRSIVPLLKGETPTDWNQDYYGEYSMINYCRAFMRCYRTPEWKLVRDFLNPQRDELYDLTNDPAETRNLIHMSDPRIKQIIGRLDAKIHQHMEQNSDELLREITHSSSSS